MWASMVLIDAQACTKPHPKNRTEPSPDPSPDLDGDAGLTKQIRHGKSINQLRIQDLW